jgi:hypothetical protein
MPMIPRAFCLGIVLVNLAGCYTGNNTYPYPNEWPRRLASDGEVCPDISGSYVNFAAQVSGERARGNALSDLLANEVGSGSNDCRACMVKITWLDSERRELSVEFGAQSGDNQVDGKGERLVLNRADKEFSCADGVLTLPVSRGGTVILASGMEIGHCDLVPAEDGSLIAYQDYTLAGYVLVFPVGGKERTFSRFERIPDPPTPD